MPAFNLSLVYFSELKAFDTFSDETSTSQSTDEMLAGENEKKALPHIGEAVKNSQIIKIQEPFIVELTYENGKWKIEDEGRFERLFHAGFDEEGD